MRKAAVAKAEPETHLSTPLQENINRVEIEGASASSVTEAIQVLSIAQDEKVDKHPEKRMEAMRKAAVAKAEPETHLSTPLEENINRVEIEGASASSVTEAIQVLNIAQDEKVDKHP